jgi:hypothetical protein
MIEIDLALTRELQAIVPAVQYAQQRATSQLGR